MPDACVAACAVELSPSSGALLLFPPGEFRASQGAMRGAGPWRIDAAAAARVIAAAVARGVKIPIDYEHQTLRAAENGQPAPAAGWIDPARLVWDDARGLIDPAPEWTARAAAAIDAREYLYGSPVFRYDPGTGEVLELLHFAVTNTPAIDRYRPIGAASASIPPTEETPRMSHVLIAALGLPAETDEAAAVAALTALTQERDRLKAETATAAAAVATANGTIAALQAEVAALKGAETQRQAEALIAEGLADGRILPAMEQWARGLAATSLDALKGYLDTAAPIAALVGNQTGGKGPAGSAAADEWEGDEDAKKAYDRAVAAGRVKITGGSK